MIEAVSGRAYDAFLREAIFDPLQMRDTGYDQLVSMLLNTATYPVPDGVQPALKPLP